MKKKQILFALALIFGVLLASCSSSKHTCPAYSKAKVEQSGQHNS